MTAPRIVQASTGLAIVGNFGGVYPEEADAELRAVVRDGGDGVAVRDVLNGDDERPRRSG